jgi:DNA-directed RNA polymerase subunit RPC12/RpoP
MDNVKTFQCPNCGSSVNTTGAEREVKCAYCGTTVIVPEELRDQAEPMQTNYAPMPQVEDEVLKTISTVGKAAARITYS